MTSIMSWFFIFISLIYLGNEYLYTTDLPRLITLFATLCMVVGFITSDIVLLRLQEFLSRSGSLERTQLLILGAGFPSITQYFRSHPLYQISERSYARGLEEIRKGSIEEVLYFVDQKPEYLDTLIELCRIYGVRLRVVETRTERYGEHTEVGLLRGLPCVEIHFQSQKAW